METTIASLVPVKVSEKKNSLIPSDYEIPASNGTIPQVLHVSGAIHYVYIGENLKKFPVRVPADELATSIVNDLIHATLAVDFSSKAMPGIFWVPGKLSSKEIMQQFAEFVSEAIENQKRWFLALVKMGDDDWQKLHRHSAISDLQRKAAKLLNLQDREWIVEERAGLVACPACKTLIQLGTIRCPTCTTILDPVAYKKFSEPLVATK